MDSRNGSSTAVPAAEGWAGEAVRRVWFELSLCARTFLAFLVRPGRSARSWQDGDRTYMNPLGFSATAAGMYWAMASALGMIWPISGPEGVETIADQLTSAVGPYAHYGLLGLSMHYGLRWFGHARGTSALELQAGDWVPLGLFVAALVAYGALCFVMARAMMGLHRAPAWKGMGRCHVRRRSHGVAVRFRAP